MSPEADDFHDAFLLQDLANEMMPDIYPPRIRPRQISHRFVEGRRGLEWILTDEAKPFLGFRFEAGSREFSGVFPHATCAESSTSYMSAMWGSLRRDRAVLVNAYFGPW